MVPIPKLTLLEGPVLQQEFELTENEMTILGHAVPGVSASSSMAASMPKEAGIKPTSKPPRSRFFALRQFTILSLRNLEILTRDPISLVLMLFIPPKEGYRSKILVAWGVQVGIITLIFFLVLFAIRLKDRV